VDRFIELCARESDDELLGLHLGGQLSVLDFGHFGSLIKQSLTMGAAMRKAEETFHLLNGALQERYRMDRRQGCVWFEVQSLGGKTVGSRHVEWLTAMSTINSVRLALGRDWRPSVIHFTGKPFPRLKNDESLDGIPSKFNARCTAFPLPLSILYQPFNLYVEAQPESSNAEGARDQSGNLIGSVRAFVNDSLATALPTIETAAEASGLSTRTLQRQLAAHGLTYKQLIHQARFNRAVSLLLKRDSQIREIADELGYSHAAHFIRAFRSWTGLSPSEYRSRIIGLAADMRPPVSLSRQRARTITWMGRMIRIHPRPILSTESTKD
jgi:AraC-like DNA-binding protein